MVAWASSIVYQLGTPIPVTGKDPITELEFLASTYGDIEDVMSANDSIAPLALLVAAVRDLLVCWHFRRGL